MYSRKRSQNYKEFLVNMICLIGFSWMYNVYIHKIIPKTHALRDDCQVEFAKILLHLPGVVSLQQFFKVVILLLSTNLSNLGVNGLVVSRSIDIADNTQSYGESIAITHQQSSGQSLVVPVRTRCSRQTRVSHHVSHRWRSSCVPLYYIRPHGFRR